jgi:hypothetical protein
MNVSGNPSIHDKTHPMEVQTIDFKTERWLFYFVDKILRENNLYMISYDRKIGFTVDYWFPDDPECIYKVIKGHDEKGFKFFITTDINEECMLYLKQGDFLLFEFEHEYIDKVWFTCTTMLIGAKTMDADYAVGVTYYGSINKMLKEGLIERAIVL